MYILGITTMTDSSAVLLKDNKIIGAIEEERFTRSKHQNGFPLKSVKYLLAKENLKISDIDEVSVYWNPWKLFGRTKYLLSFIFNINIFLIKFLRSFNIFFGKNDHSSGWFNLFLLNNRTTI